jgi:2-hydroxy-3-keto-5-methylthiopentenyl-1-phosphate phosphatase
MIVAEKPLGIPTRKNGDADLRRSKGILVICDFDGTACTVDMGNRLLDRFAGAGWRDIGHAYSADEIGSCVAYTKIAPLIRGNRGRMLEYVRTTAALDPSFVEFYRFCRECGYDLKIASDGLDFYIEAVLKKHGLADIEFYANTTVFGPGEGLAITFPHLNNSCGKCGTCKSTIVRRCRDQYEKIIYIGDSYSDICPSKTADIVFAKHILYEKCKENGTDCIYYNNFYDIVNSLENFSCADAIPAPGGEAGRSYF